MRDLRELSKNFHEREFVYRVRTEGDRLIAPIMDMEFMAALQQFRDYLGKTINTTVLNGFNGGWRAPQHETYKLSQHCIGKAADVFCPDLDLQDLYNAVLDFNVKPGFYRFRGVGVYPQNSFLHLDVRATPAKWMRCDGKYFSLGP